MAQNKVVRRRSKKKKQGIPFVGFLLMVGTTAFAVYMIATTIVFILGMIPTAVAAFTDSDKEKTAGLTVGAMNFVGVFFVLLDLWQNNNTVDMAMRLISIPSNWAVMFVPAIIGWGIYFYFPPFISVFLKKQMEARANVIEEKQARYVEEWGSEVAELAMRAIPNSMRN